MARETKPGWGRRVGYVVAIAVNLVLIFVVNNLLDWGWPSFLTDDFEQLLPLINLSLMASIVANLIYLWFDPAWFKSMTQIVLGMISLVVTVRTLQVFPFDFSGYDVNWEAVTRVVLVFLIVVIGIAVLVEIGKLIRLGYLAGTSQRQGR
jgi:hypothetical protein